MASTLEAHQLKPLFDPLDVSEAQMTAAVDWCQQMSLTNIDSLWEVVDEDAWFDLSETMGLTSSKSSTLRDTLATRRDEAKEKLARANSKKKYPPLPSLDERLTILETYGLQANQYEFDLSDEPLGDEGAARLLNALRTNNSLKRLLMTRCRLSLAGLDHMGTLLLEGARSALARVDARPRTASQSPGSSPDASPGGDHGSGGYADTLQLLNLTGNDFGPHGPSPHFLEGLALSVNLRSLSFSCCSLGDRGTRRLIEVLSQRDSGDQMACHLAELDISSNNLTEATAKLLPTLFGQNQSLRTLRVDANELGRKGAPFVAEAIRKGKGRLERLYAAQNNFKLDGARDILDAFIAPVTIHVNINRQPGQTAGLTLNEQSKILGVTPASVLDSWNSENPADEVMTGDYVVRVNDKTVTSELENALNSETELDIVFHRPGAEMKFLDLSNNRIGLAGVEELRDEIGRNSEGTMTGNVLRWHTGRQCVLNAC